VAWLGNPAIHVNQIVNRCVVMCLTEEGNRRDDYHQADYGNKPKGARQVFDITR